MPSVPLHLLTRNETVVWLLKGEAQRGIASKLTKEYREGVGILSFTGYLIAYVQPNGAIRELTPPFSRHDRHEVANKPSVGKCACADFFDPEIQGPWKLRNSPDHHPLCQFDKYAQAVFSKLSTLPVRVATREDTMKRVQEEVMGTRGEKTGPRRG